MSARQRVSPEKKYMIAGLIEACDIKTTADIQDALKDLSGVLFWGKPDFVKLPHAMISTNQK